MSIPDTIYINPSDKKMIEDFLVRQSTENDIEYRKAGVCEWTMNFTDDEFGGMDCYESKCGLERTPHGEDGKFCRCGKKIKVVT